MKDLLKSFEEKYSTLVWYARKHPKDDPSWDDVPADIMKGAFDAMDDAESTYPEDIEDLAGRDGDWHHGFNSGVLAAIRLIMTAKNESVEAAVDNFPELDT